VNIVFIPIGSAGDVYPFLGLAQVLARRGHSITVVTNPKFSALVEQQGFEFVPLGTAEDFDRISADPDMWNGFRAFKLIARWAMLNTMRPIYEEIESRYKPGETVVVSQVTAFGARLAQEKLGVPLACLHLQPSVFRSFYETPTLPPMLSGNGVPRWLKRAQFFLADKLVVDPLVLPELNAFRRELQLPPVSRPMKDWWYSPQRNIALFPEWFAPRQPDWPENTVLTGFPNWDPYQDEPLSSDTQKFLSSGSPPIVWTPGSAVQHAREFFVTAVETCLQLGRRGMLLTRHPDQLPPVLPTGVQHFDYVPLRTLMPLAAALVHHGGIGTTSQALAAGRPQLIMPMAHDQPDNAARVTRLGVGAAVPVKRFTGPVVSEVLGRLLKDSSVARACVDVFEKMQHQTPLDQAAGEVEALFGSDTAQ